METVFIEFLSAIFLAIAAISSAIGVRVSRLRQMKALLAKDMFIPGPIGLLVEARLVEARLRWKGLWLFAAVASTAPFFVGVITTFALAPSKSGAVMLGCVVFSLLLLAAEWRRRQRGLFGRIRSDVLVLRDWVVAHGGPSDGPPDGPRISDEFLESLSRDLEAAKP